MKSINRYSKGLLILSLTVLFSACRHNERDARQKQSTIIIRDSIVKFAVNKQGQLLLNDSTMGLEDFDNYLNNELQTDDVNSALIIPDPETKMTKITPIKKVLLNNAIKYLMYKNEGSLVIRKMKEQQQKQLYCKVKKDKGLFIKGRKIESQTELKAMLTKDIVIEHSYALYINAEDGTSYHEFLKAKKKIQNVIDSLPQYNLEVK